jgi:hypothetical protein
MVSYMKTTVEIPDTLLDAARRLAASERTTVKSLIIEGLRRLLRERGQAAPFRLRDASFHGQGLQPDVADGTWERIRDVSYEGRGS